MRKFCKVMTILTFLLSQTFGAIFYVDGSVGTSGNGTSWGTAFKTVESGILAATAANDEIWIKAGIYSTSNATNAYTISQDIKLYGGFAGTESNLSERKDIFSTNKTTLTTTTTARILEVKANATIEGLIITGGNIVGPGAGILVQEEKNVTINDCKIVGNSITQTAVTSPANAGGGGIFINKALAIVNINNCLIAGNISRHIGGGVCVNAGTANIRSSTIVGNFINASNWGAGVVKQGGGFLNLYNSVVWGNRHNGTGAAVENDLLLINIRENNSDVTHAENCAFEIGYINKKPTRPAFVNCFWLISNLNSNSTTLAPNTAGFITPNQATLNAPCDWETANYNLSEKSILINSGNNLNAIGSIDLNNNPRIWNNENGGIIDIGAYEKQSPNEINVIYTGFENSVSIGGLFPIFSVQTDPLTAKPEADWELVYYDNPEYSGEPVSLSSETAMTYYVKAVDKKNNWFAANTTSFIVMGESQSLTIDDTTTQEPELSSVTGEVTPKSGFFVDKLTYINVMPNETLGGKYNFIMPKEQVTINSTQLEIPTNIAFVTNNGSGDKNGYSWNNAFASIKDAITANRTIIYVANGTYNDDLNIPVGTEIYGGFSINENLPANRIKGENFWDFTNKATITGQITVSGKLDGFSILPLTMNTQLNLSGIIENCYSEKTRINIKADNVVVRGCKITGNTCGTSNSNYGGLIYKENCTSITNLDKAWDTLVENSVLSNGTAFLGGAIFYGCTDSAGSNSNGKLTLQNCLIIENKTAGNNPNAAKPFGGAVHIHGSLADIINCTIVNNLNTSVSDITNGTGISGAQFGTTLPIPVPKINVINTILWNNKNNTATKTQVAIESNVNALLTITNSACNDAGFETTYSTNDNIQLTDDNPGFIDPSTDFSLSNGSDLVGTGLNQTAQPNYDLAGNNRIVGNNIDIGAYECQTLGTVLKFSVSGHKTGFYTPEEEIIFTITDLTNPPENYTDTATVSKTNITQNLDKTFTYKFTDNDIGIVNFVFTRSTTESGYLDFSVNININVRKIIKDHNDETPIFITWGQSNADGSASPNESVENFLETWYSDTSNDVNKLKMFHSPTAATSANGITWATSKSGTAKWMNLYYKNDINNNKTAMNIVDSSRGMEGSFGMKFYDNFKGNKELYMLKLGISGTPIAAYSAVGDYADDVNEGYSANINWQYWMNNIWKPAIQELLNQGKKPRLAGIWWMQGEREANNAAPYGTMSKDDYEMMLKELVRKTRIEMGFKTADFYIGHICKPGENDPISLIDGISVDAKAGASIRYNNTGDASLPSNVRDAQEAVASTDDNVHIFSETKNAEFGSDSLHYSQSGLHYIGATLADKVHTNGIEKWADFSNPIKWSKLSQNDTDIQPVEVTPYFTPQKISIFYKLQSDNDDANYSTDLPKTYGKYDVKVNLNYKTWSEDKFETLTIETLKITPENIQDVLNYARDNDVDSILFEIGDYSKIGNIIFEPQKNTSFIANGDVLLPEITISKPCKLARFHLQKITVNAKTEIYRCSTINGEIINPENLVAKSTLFWKTPTAAGITSKENSASEYFKGDIIGSVDTNGNLKLDSTNDGKFGPKLDENNKPQKGSILINRGGK